MLTTRLKLSALRAAADRLRNAQPVLRVVVRCGTRANRLLPIILQIPFGISARYFAPIATS